MDQTRGHPVAQTSWHSITHPRGGQSEEAGEVVGPSWSVPRPSAQVGNTFPRILFCAALDLKKGRCERRQVRERRRCLQVLLARLCSASSSPDDQQPQAHHQTLVGSGSVKAQPATEVPWVSCLGGSTCLSVQMHWPEPPLICSFLPGVSLPHRPLQLGIHSQASLHQEATF